MLIHPYNFKRMFVMANVKITREHNLGIAQAMIRARGLVDGLAEQYGLKTGGLRFQVQQSVDSVEPIGCQQLQMIRQHFNREFPAQCLTRSGVEQVGNLVQPLLANQRQIGALG